MRNIHHLPPLKRAKHRITADLHDFLTFPGTDGRIAADLDDRPFRDTVKTFLEIHAWPAHGGFDSEKHGRRTWRMMFKVGVETVELVITEEDVSRSRSIYCDQCRVVGWSGHPVCKERYHFIISRTPGYYICTRCQNTLPPNNLRCHLCGYEMKIDGLENLAYPKLDDPGHLLHGVVHTNGYGHLLRLNGREGGSKLLAGHHIMSFWDRLCKLLHVRKITVMDVSRKFGMEYRLLHAVVTGHPWYGEWGYEFRQGSFALTDNEYQKAVETLSSIPLSIFFNYNRQSRLRLQNTIVFYWTLSGHTLVTLRDLFSFVIQQLNIASQKTESDNCTKGQMMVVGHTSGLLNNNDLEQQVETAVIKILKAVGNTKWVTEHALRGAVCRRAKSPDVMDHFLQTLGGKIISDGSIITARYNADANTIEYSLQTAPSHTLPEKHPKPTADHILRDLKFLYHSLLDPSSMEPYKPKLRRESALGAARTVLDCKRLIKDYDEGSAWLSSNPFAFTVWCHVKANGNIAPPQEPVQLPLSGTIADLRHEATKAFQETYVIFKGFQAELLLDYERIDDNFQVKNLIGFNGTVRLEGKWFDEQRLADFKMERGTDKWVVDCTCGTKDDDGERMLACDACGEWQHTRCLGFHDFELVPARFTCKKCICNPQRPVRRLRGRPRTCIPDAYKCKEEVVPSTILQAQLWVDV